MSQNVNPLQIVPVIDQDNPFLNLPDVCLKNICDRLSLRDFVLLASTCKDARRLVDLFDDKTRYFLSNLMNIPFPLKYVITLPFPPCERIDFRKFNREIFLSQNKPSTLAKQTMRSVRECINQDQQLNAHPNIDLLIHLLKEGYFDEADYILPSITFDSDLYDSVFSELISGDHFLGCKMLLQKMPLSFSSWIRLTQFASQNLPIKQLLIQHAPLDVQIFINPSDDLFHSLEEYKMNPELIDDQIKAMLLRYVSVAIILNQTDSLTKLVACLPPKELVSFVRYDNDLNVQIVTEEDPAHYQRFRLLAAAVDVKELSEDMGNQYLDLSLRCHALFDLSIKILQNRKPPLAIWLELFNLKKSPWNYRPSDAFVETCSRIDALRQQLRSELPYHPFFKAVQESHLKDASTILSQLSLEEFDCLVLAATATKSLDCLKILIRDPKMSKDFFKQMESSRYMEPTLGHDDAQRLVDFLVTEGMVSLAREICEHTSLSMPETGPEDCIIL